MKGKHESGWSLPKVHRKAAFITLVFGLAGYQGFLAYCWYLRDSAIEFPLLLGLPLYLTMMTRIIFINFKFTDEELRRLDDSVILLRIPVVGSVSVNLASNRTLSRLARYSRTIDRRWILLENLEWVGILLFVYWHLYRDFGFPGTLPKNDLLIVLGELIFAFGSAICIVLIVVSLQSLTIIWRDIRSVIYIIPRIVSVFFVYFLVDLAFSLMYRVAFFLDHASFSKPIDSFVTALYFSTVTLSTLGYGDISPQNDGTKLLVCLETIVGLVLLVAVLSVSISVGLSQKPEDRT